MITEQLLAELVTGALLVNATANVIGVYLLVDGRQERRGMRERDEAFRSTYARQMDQLVSVTPRQAPSAQMEVFPGSIGVGAYYVEPHESHYHIVTPDGEMLRRRYETSREAQTEVDRLNATLVKPS